MSKADRSRSGSDPDAAATPGRRDEWRELNAAQLVCIATGTVAALFGAFAGVLILSSAMTGWGGSGAESFALTASIPSLTALACSAGAVVFTRSGAARRAARQECAPAVLLALSGLLGVAIAWAMA